MLDADNSFMNQDKVAINEELSSTHTLIIKQSGHKFGD